MTFDYELTLIKTSYKENEMGDSVEVKSERPVLVSILDYRNKDFYQAMINGHKPEKTFGINKHEYDGEKEAQFEGTTYRIIDVHPIKAKDITEFETIVLICSGLVNK